MIWWILGVIVLLIVLLCLLRVGAQVRMQAGELTVRVRIGPVGFQVYPPKKKKASSKAEEKPKKEKKDKKPKDPSKKLPKPSFADIKDAIRTLWPPLKRALGRFGRGIRIHPLQIGVRFGGGKDAAGAAELYGWANAGVWTVMPVLEKLMDIPEPGISLGLDFENPSHVIEADAGITIRIGTLLAMAFGVGIPALRWFLTWKKKMAQQPKAEPAVAEENNTAA